MRLGHIAPTAFMLAGAAVAQEHQHHPPEQHPLPPIGHHWQDSTHGVGPVVPAIGVAVNVGAVPDSVAGAYGTSVPVGAFVFVGLQPPKMSIGHQHRMSGM